MILLKIQFEAPWLGLVIVGGLFLVAIISVFIPELQDSKEDKRLMKLYRDSYNKTAPAQTEAETNS